ISRDFSLAQFIPLFWLGTPEVIFYSCCSQRVFRRQPVAPAARLDSWIWQQPVHYIKTRIREIAMTGPRRALALATTLLAIQTLLATQCLAQDSPTRPIRIIVPFGAGGPADVTARLIGNILQESFGQPFVVENRTGAGGVIGTLEPAKSPPDRYTMLMMSHTETPNESIV